VKKENQSCLQVGKKGSLYYKKGKLIEKETEAFRWLTFLYTSFFGRFLRRFFRRRFFTRLYSWWPNSRWSKRAIQKFIKKHQIEMKHFQVPSAGYTSFNDFFIRKLKPGARSIDRAPRALVAPTDSKLLVIENITRQAEFLVKGKPFNLEKLLTSRYLTQKYLGGIMMLFRLASYDYHRFHFPVDCRPSQKTIIHGVYESVNPIVYQSGVQPLTHNERHLVMLDTVQFNQIAVVIVGAMLVGKIVHAYTPDKDVKKGDEMGYFAFGASSIIFLLKPGLITTRSDILTHSQQGYETAVVMGEKIAELIKHK
jgi:phosphatidylserine decarboxylase